MNLLQGLIIIQGGLQTLDGDFLVEVSGFPYIGDGANGDWTTAHFGDLTRYDARGWKGRAVTTDGLKFLETFSRQIAVGGNGTNGLGSRFRS